MKKSLFFFLFLIFNLSTFCLFAQEKTTVSPTDLEVEKLIRQKDYLRTRIYEIVEENKILEEKVKLFEGKAKTYEDVVLNNQKMISELKVVQDQMAHDLKALQEENNSLLSSLEDKESFIHNIQENVEKEKEAAKKQLLAELEQKNQNFEAVQGQLKELQVKSENIQAQYTQAQETLILIQKENVEFSEKNKFYVSKMVELEESIKNESIQHEEQMKKISFKNDDLNSMIEKMSVENIEQLSQERDLSMKEQSSQTVSDLIAENKANSAQLSKVKDSHSIEMTAENKKYAALDQKYNQNIQENDRLNQTIKALKVNNQDLEAKIDSYMADKKSKEATLTELTKNKESLTKELASFSERYKTLEEKFNQISKSAVKNEALIAKEVEKARKPLEELNANLEKRVIELTDMVEKAGESVSQLVEKKRDVELMNRSLTNDNKKINEKLAALEQQLKSTQESFELKMTEMKTPLDGKILFLEEKLKKSDGNDAVISRISKEKNQLQAELKNLQKENSKLTKDLAAVNDLLHETDGFLAKKVKESMIEKEAEIKQLREKLGMTETQGKVVEDVSLKGK